MTQIKKKCFAALAALAMAVCAFADAKTDALINATRNNDTAEVSRLIKSGADVNAKNEYGWNAHIRALIQIL